MRFFAFLSLLLCTCLLAVTAQASELSVSYLKDTGRKENFQSFISKLDSNGIALKKHDANEPLHLGRDGDAYWIVLNVEHSNLQEPLTIYFGNTDHGRSGSR